MKKIICILLGIVLVASCLSSCSSKKEGENTAASAAESPLLFSYDMAYSNSESGAVNAYKAICSAIINYETELRINVELTDSAYQLLFSSFPLYELVDDFKDKEDGSGITISYKYDKDTHLKAVSDFTEKVQSIKNACADSNKNVYAIKLYNYIASSIQESDDISVTYYNTIMNGVGTSFSYSKMFEYLLQQGGINTYHVLASDLGGKGWGLTAAELDGQIYYFDIMGEHYSNEGSNLLYFGMTSEDVENIGLRNLSLTDRTAAPDASDLRFEMCRQCEEWKIEDGNLLITKYDGVLIQINL